MKPVDWEADPELKQLRDEFIDSFGPRRQMLTLARDALARGDEEATPVLLDLCHKLAGAAESYGFRVLSEIGARIEDLIRFGQPTGRELRAEATLLDEALGWAIEHRGDPAALAEDPRLSRLRANP